ncbi:MAG: hypothetical protein ACLFQP_03420 [Halothece sp.]
MRSNTVIFVLALTIIFVAAGDSFLPQPLAKASSQARRQLNEFFLGLFPETDNIGEFGGDRLQKMEGTN